MSNRLAKIETLLLSDDFSFVQQGFELLKTLPSIDFGAFSFSVRWVDNYQYSHFALSKECTHSRYVACALYGMRLAQDSSFTPKEPTTRMHFTGPIPPEIGAFKDLDELTLTLDYGTSIAEIIIPNEIADIPKLRELHITTRDAILRLPDNIGSCPSLKSINLDSNTSIELPHSFGNLSTLESLTLKHLKGSNISFDGLTSLQSLSIGDYRVGMDSSTLPNLFTQPHPNLKMIYIYDTNDTLASWLKYLPLKDLSVECPKIETSHFPANAFPELEKLTFKGGGLYTLDDAFLTYPNLKKLEVNTTGTHIIIPKSYKHVDFEVDIQSDKVIAPLDVAYSKSFTYNRQTLENPDERIEIYKTPGADKWHKCVEGEPIPSTATNIDMTDIYEPKNELKELLAKRSVNALRIDFDHSELTEKISEWEIEYYYNPTVRKVDDFPSSVYSLSLTHEQIEIIGAKTSRFKFLESIYIEPQYANERTIDLTPLTAFELETLDVSDHRLSFVNDVLPEGLTAIYLSKEMFLKFQNKLPKSLKYLSLRGYQLTEIPECIFNLPNLIGLDLSGNNLKTLPDKLFSLTQLQRLDLSGNDLDDLAQIERISNLPQLETLSLNLMGLRSLPDLSSLEKLGWLSAFGNHLTHVSDNLLYAKLEEAYVDLAHNDIEEISGTLANVYGIDLSFNYLMDASGITCPAIGLEHNPPLKKLPTSEVDVSLDREQVIALSSQFATMNLWTLNLSGAGRHETYHGTIERIQNNGTFTDLSENDLPSLAHCKQLNNLFLDNNAFTQIPTLPSSVSWVSMEHNRLGDENGVIKLHSEAPLANLFALHLAHNPTLKDIQTSYPLNALSSFDISNCAFDDIPDILGETEELDNVQIDGNPFKSLSNIDKLPRSVMEKLRVNLFERLFPEQYEANHEGGNPNHHCLITERDDLPFEIKQHYVLNELNGDQGKSQEIATFTFLDTPYKVSKWINFQWDEKYTVEHRVEFWGDLRPNYMRTWFQNDYDTYVNDDLVAYFNPLALGTYLKQIVPTPDRAYELNDVSAEEICASIDSLKTQFQAWTKKISTDFHTRADNKHFLTEVVCNNANLDNIALQNTHYSGVKFCGASLRNTDFTDSMFYGCNLCGADFTGSNITVEQFGSEKIKGYWASSRRNFSLYDKHTKWPEGFDPAESPNLVEMNQRLYRIVMARYLKNLRQGSWNWGLSDFEAVLTPFGIQLNDDGKTTIPAVFLASFNEIMGHFVSPNPTLNTLFEIGDCEYIEEPDLNLKPVRERFEDEEMDQEFHGFWRNERSTEHMLQMFPDAVILENSFHANDWRAEEPNKATVDLLEFADEQTWVVLTNHLCHWGYADENFDLSGTFEYTFFDNKEDAYAEWLRIDKEYVVSQKSHNVHILSKWTNLFGASDWERYFRTDIGINSPMWLKLFQEPERFEAQCSDFVAYCDEVIEQWKNAGNKE